MKKLGFVLLAMTAVACNGDDDGDTKIKCSATCNDLLRTDDCKIYSSTAYEGGTLKCNTTTCQLDFSGCQAKAVIPPAELLEACTGTGAGNCVENLVCTDFQALRGKRCVDDCLSDTDCGAGAYCNGTGWAGTDFCYATAARNGKCLPALDDSGNDGCTDANTECTSLVGVSFECLLTCGGDNVGTTTGCTGTESCLAAPWVEVQQEGSIDKVCTVSTDCDEAAKYECISVAVSESSSQLLCARRAGLCGNAAPVMTQFSAAALDAWIEDKTHLCEVPETNIFCGPSDPSATAEVECAGTGWGYIWVTEGSTEGVSCVDQLDCMFVGGDCINFSSGAQCGGITNVCVAFCESGDGTETFSCPTATPTCGVPESDIGFPVVEYVGTTPTTCTTNANCNEAEGFACTEFSDGKYCARPRKVCM